MSYSNTITETKTFTATHAKHIAAKVATDLKRIQRFYDSPSDSRITQFETEIIELLKYGYLQKVTYGFKEKENWIEPTLSYTAKELDNSVSDDPGKIRANRNISNSSFYSFLEYSDIWYQLSESERQSFKNTLPFTRDTADTPGISGYLENDRTYASGGRALSRSSVRSYE